MFRSQRMQCRFTALQFNHSGSSRSIHRVKGLGYRDGERGGGGRDDMNGGRVLVMFVGFRNSCPLDKDYDNHFPRSAACLLSLVPLSTGLHHGGSSTWLCSILHGTSTNLLYNQLQGNDAVSACGGESFLGAWEHSVLRVKVYSYCTAAFVFTSPPCAML